MARLSRRWSSPQGLRSVLSLGLRTITNIITGYAMHFLVLVCSDMLCVHPSAIFFLHQNSHPPRILCVSCSLCYSTFFFFLFSSCTEFEFLVKGQRPFTVDELRQKHFCTLTKSDPAIKRAQEFQARLHFPVLGAVRGRHTYSVLL